VRPPVRILRPDPLLLPVSRAEVLRYLGYKPGKTRLTAAVEPVIDQGIAKAVAAARPAISLAYCRVEQVEGDEVSLALPGLRWTSAALARMLRQAVAVTLVAATVGPAIEEQVQQLFQAQEYAMATVVDAAGSALIHGLVQYAAQELAAESQPWSLRLTPLLSPGYADWPLSDLPALMEQVGAEQIGLHRTESLYLMPQKSLVGLIGWVSEAARLPASGCQICAQPNCPYRKVESR
jgi:hypothetical protein